MKVSEFTLKTGSVWYLSKDSFVNWMNWLKLIYKIQQMLMNLLTHANESDKKSQDIQQKHLSLEPKLSYIFKRTWNKA